MKHLILSVLLFSCYVEKPARNPEWINATLVQKHRTTYGIKLVFVSSNNDTLVKYKNVPWNEFEVGKCYNVLKSL